MSAAKDDFGLSPRERTFADGFIGGLPAGRAYERAGYKARGGSADSLACKMLRKDKLMAYVRAARRRMAEADQYQKWQLIEFLTRAITTPVGQIDEESDLAQEVTREEIGEQVARTRIKIVGKLDAAKQLATLLSWNAPEKITLDASEQLAGLLQKIRSRS
jgi:phage terminase small subunit